MASDADGNEVTLSGLKSSDEVILRIREDVGEGSPRAPHRGTNKGVGDEDRMTGVFIIPPLKGEFIRVNQGSELSLV